MCSWGTTKITTIWSSYSIILPAFWSTSGNYGMMMYLSSSSGVPYCSAGVQSRSRSTMLARFTSWCKMARFTARAGDVLKMAACYVRCWCTAFLMEAGHVDCWWELQRLVVTGALSEDWDMSGTGRARTWHSDAERAPTERAPHQPNAQRQRWFHVRDHGWHGDVFRCGILVSAEMASAGLAQNCVRVVCAYDGGRMASVISRWREYLLRLHAPRR
jgi:hypothetical protein